MTDRQTERRTDILQRHSPRYAYASRGKNAWMDLDEILRVDRCRNMYELVNFWARSGYRNQIYTGFLHFTKITQKRVDGFRWNVAVDMNELIHFWGRSGSLSGYRNRIAFSDIVGAATRNFITPVSVFLTILEHSPFFVIPWTHDPFPNSRTMISKKYHYMTTFLVDNPRNSAHLKTLIDWNTKPIIDLVFLPLARASPLQFFGL